MYVERKDKELVSKDKREREKKSEREKTWKRS